MVINEAVMLAKGKLLKNSYYLQPFDLTWQLVKEGKRKKAEIWDVALVAA